MSMRQKISHVILIPQTIYCIKTAKTCKVYYSVCVNIRGAGWAITIQWWVKYCTLLFLFLILSPYTNSRGQN